MSAWEWFLAATLTAFIALEVRALVTGKPTLSIRIREWSDKWPIIPIFVSFVAGAVAGHWWWPL